MQPTPNMPQTYAEGSMQNQPNSNSITNSYATPSQAYGDARSDGTDFANQMKMRIANRLVPVEDDGSINPSRMNRF